MATGNRSPRNPGQIQRFTGQARIADTPDYVVPGGDAAAALTALGSGVASRLKQMAIRAATREGELAGLSAGQRAGIGYLDRRTSEAAADPGTYDLSPHVPAGKEGHLSGIDPQFRGALSALFAAAPPEIRAKLTLNSGYRSEERQAELYQEALAKYGSPEAARKWVAPPGKSQHNDGMAYDLAYGSDAARDWVQANAGRFGLAFPMAHEPWHIELAGARAGAPAQPATGGLNPQPLALRNDNTVFGDAFDAAAIRSFGWRMQEGLGNDIAAAYDQYKDDPTAWQQALGEIHARYSGDPSLGAPELREVFDKSFADRTSVYSREVLQRQETRLMQEQAGAYAASFDATMADLERQAYILGANPEADAALGSQADRLLNQIATAEANNIITPAQASAQREKLNTTLASARVQGVFASLETPAQQEAFATGLLDEWAQGKGPMAGMPLASVKAMSQTLYSQARAAQNQLTAESKAELGRVQGLIADDLASIAATGQGIDLAANALTPERLAALGIDSQAWAADREFAQRAWEATSGMELESVAELNDRLAALAPAPGSPGFADQAQIHAAAVKQAQAVLKERETDPLGQAARAGLVALEPVDPASPDSLALRRQQANVVAATYGTPVSYFRPEERTALTSALYQQPELMPGFALGVVKAFGDEAGTALSELSDAGPELAYAAGITAELGDNGVISEVSRVIAGRRDKTINVKMPSDAVMTSAAGAVLGSAMAGNLATRAAALNVAQILFEGQAAALGFDPADIKEPGSAAFAAWERSVNRALGARMINGEQYGGMTTVNGGLTVAPAGMTGARLQQLVSSLSADDLAALPPIATGNGVPLAAWQLQGAQLVAIGDGQYRVALNDPNGLEPQFVMQPGGEFWVLDAEALEAIRATAPAAGTMGLSTSIGVAPGTGRPLQWPGQN